MSVHFVVPQQFANELCRLPDQKVGVNFPYWLGGRFNWAAQSWLILRQWRPDFTCGFEPLPGQINMGHAKVWRDLGQRRGEFRVSFRADYTRLFDVDFELLQNPLAPLSKRQAYAPYWPIPGLIQRSNRRQKLTTIAYAGRIGAKNLSSEIECAIACRPEAKGMMFLKLKPSEWHDMSEIDLLLAIRDFDGRPHYDKPPSKLFNAWHARVPLIGGYDSAFSHIGCAGIDYMRVRTIDELFEGIARLRSSPARYSSIVNAGALRAAEFTHERIASIWLQLIDGPISRAYGAWCATGGSEQCFPFRSLLDRTYEAAVSVKEYATHRSRSAAT